MRRLCNTLLAGLELPSSATTVDLFAALCARMSQERSRRVTFQLVHFPTTSSVSGLWLNLDGQDLLAVERHTDPSHQCVIFGHEVWHMYQGQCRPGGQEAVLATRLLAGKVDLESAKDAVLRVAARTHFDNETEEREADAFGYRLSTRCRPLLRPSADGSRTPRDALARRIEAALGHRGPQE
ncbi:toxin-antitoxin system, toxin component [Streptomyces spectabilis]|nr:toxin-antitoxin system, toxin component [Streptomyces spectabilis]